MRFPSPPLSSRSSQQHYLLMMLISYGIVIVVLTRTSTTTSTVLTFAQAHEQHQHQSPTLRRQIQNRQHQRRYLNVHEEEKGVFVVETSSSSLSSTIDDNVNGNNRIHRRTLQELNFCKLYQEDIYFHPEDDRNGSVDKWTCTFEDYIDESGTKYPHSVDIDGVNIKEALQKAGAKSGVSYLQWKSTSDILIDDRYIILTVDMTNENISIETPTTPNTNNARSLRISATGVKKTLVIRIVGDKIGPIADRTRLYDDIFDSEICLKSQMEACSRSQLIIQPFSGQTYGQLNANIDGGVVELRITTNPKGKSDKQMENDANLAAASVFGNLSEQFDLVLFAMPPGIEPAFAAYAYIGSPFSYYSDKNILDVMVQMHEIGHNIGLQHAGQGEEEYGDPSGYMGYSSKEDPRMCYNAANNYQLGWYSQYSIRPTGIDGYGGTFTISGVAGYDQNETNKFVSLRLQQESLRTDYYIGYNWAFGINIDTQEDANKVIIVEKAGDSSASEISWKKAALSVGQSYIINNYDWSGRTVTVTFTGTLGNDSIIDVIPEALPDVSPSASPTNIRSAEPSISPITISPSFEPSFKPSFEPTFESSTVEPTFNSSTVEPSFEPTFEPTFESSTFQPTGCQEASIKLIIKTDMHPKDISWRLTVKETDEIIMRINSGDYNVKNKTETTIFCLDYDASYRFKIWDAGNDGLSEGGYYTAYYQDNRNNTIIFNNTGNFEHKKTEIFTVTRTLPTIAPTIPNPIVITTPSSSCVDSRNCEKLGKSSNKYGKRRCGSTQPNGKRVSEVCASTCGLIFGVGLCKPEKL